MSASDSVVDDPRERAASRLFDGLDRPWATVGLATVVLGCHVAVGLVPYLRDRATLLGVLIRPRGPRLLTRAGAMNSAELDTGELWRLVSAVFLHGDGVHFILNVIALIALGRLGEGIFGRSRMLWIFLASGVVGMTLSWVGGNPMSVGASGGIFGLMGAPILFGWRHRTDLPDDVGSFLRRRLVPWVVFNLGVGLLLPFIDNLGHVGGLITGCILGMVLGNRITGDGEPGRVGSWALLAACLGLVCAGAWGVARQW